MTKKKTVKKAVVKGPVAEAPEFVTKTQIEKTSKVVYNITEITNRGRKTHRQLEVAAGSELEKHYDDLIAKQNDGE